MSWKVKFILLFIAFGLIVSAYLTIKAHDPAGVVCKLGGACEIVLSSRYATMFGLPVATWGLIWYSVGFILFFLTYSLRRYPWPYFLIWSLVGLAVSVYLFALETFKIHAYCTWCLSSAIAVVLIVIFTLWSRKEIYK